jgi:hypothetical protein
MQFFLMRGATRLRGAIRFRSAVHQRDMEASRHRAQLRFVSERLLELIRRIKHGQTLVTIRSFEHFEKARGRLKAFDA